MKKGSYYSITERGDFAFTTTGDIFLDLFSCIGACRDNPKVCKPLFNKAIDKDLKKSIAMLLYARDIRGGLGERKIFRELYQILAFREPNAARKIMPLVPEYGRYDDLFALIDTPVESSLYKFIHKQLLNDCDHIKTNNASLLAKWMPSLNCHNKQRKRLAKKVCKGLEMTQPRYRHLLSYLRKGRIIENDLRIMNYSFDYSKVPSSAMNKYAMAFMRNDEDRYIKYLQDVEKNKTTINAKNLHPYEIIKCYDDKMSQAEKLAMELKWQEMKKGFSPLTNTIVVRDESTNDNNLVEKIATSLTILFSEYLEGEFKDTFITFSKTPELVELKGKTLFDKLKEIYKYEGSTQSNIFKVYKLIAEHEKMCKPEYQIKHIIIVSDMEFDGETINVPTYETFKKLFNDKGLILPEVIYLNVNAKRIHFAATKDDQIKLISGASQNLLEMLYKGENLSPKDLVNKTLSPYLKKLSQL